MGMVNGCGYDRQPKDVICDAHGLCQTIRGTLERLFSDFDLFVTHTSCSDAELPALNVPYRCPTVS